MQEIKAVLRSFKVDQVVGKLYELQGMPGLTISAVKSFGKRDEHNAPIKPVLKSKLEVVVGDNMVEAVIEIIKKHAYTGKPGDGKIFIYEVKDIVKIWNDERGEAAI